MSERTPAVGRSVRRFNAERFVRGEGHYTADHRADRELTMVFLRSTQPHARIVAVDTTAAEALDGVVACWTGPDIASLIGPLSLLWNFPGQKLSHGLPLAWERVYFVGEPVVAIVARDPFVAEDARDLVEITYEPLPAVVTTGQALAPDAPLLHPEWGDNVQAVLGWPLPVGSSDEAVAGALAAADVLVTETFGTDRVLGLCMEGRATVVEYDSRGPRLTMHTSTQSPHQVRNTVARQLGIAETHLRVIVPDVGGGFGLKGAAFPEDVMVAFAALRLRRAVRWEEQRDEFFTASYPCRGQEIDMEVGFDADGRILAVRARLVADGGAYPSPIGPVLLVSTGRQILGCYEVPDAAITAVCAVTNKPPVGSYRGVGQPDANFAIERVMDIAAGRLGLDPAEIRRRNLVRTFPYDNAIAQHFDSGDYHALLELTLQRCEWDGLRRHAAQRRLQGVACGVGLAFYNESTNYGPSASLRLFGEQGGWDATTLRMEPDGRLVAMLGQTPMGQGVETALAQVLADEFAIRPEDVVIVHGDTDVSMYTAYASGASRAAGIAASSALVASAALKAKLSAIAAHMTDSVVEEVKIVPGGLMTGTGTLLGLADVAREAYLGGKLPKEIEPGLQVTGTFDPERLSFAYGCAVVLVEVDAETAEVRIEKVWFGHDCGTQINPAIVERQVIGGSVQGIGTALYEHLPYDDGGFPLVGSLRDYQLAGAHEIPVIELFHTETPGPYILNGAKGVGEAGTIPFNAAIVSAVQDALPALTRELTHIPLLPDRVLAALEENP